MLKVKELIRANVLLERKVLKEIDKFADEMAEDRSTVIRKLIRKAIASEKIESAVQKFRSGISFRKAAEMAELDYWEFQAELDKRNLPLSSSLSLARRRITQ
jgi:predicted HTH domain antitoxin